MGRVLGPFWRLTRGEWEEKIHRALDHPADPNRASALRKRDMLVAPRVLARDRPPWEHRLHEWSKLFIYRSGSGREIIG